MDGYMIPWVPLGQRCGPALGRLSFVDHSDDRPRDVGFVLDDLIPGLGLNQTVSHMLSQVHEHRPDFRGVPSSRIGLFQFREVGHFSILAFGLPLVTPRNTSLTPFGCVCLFTRSMPKRVALARVFGNIPVPSPRTVRVSATVLPAWALFMVSLPRLKSRSTLLMSWSGLLKSPTPGSCPVTKACIKSLR